MPAGGSSQGDLFPWQGYGDLNDVIYQRGNIDIAGDPVDIRGGHIQCSRSE